MPKSPHTPLPIDPVRPRITSALRERRNLVLRASTGAGKTTRVPPALVDAEFGPLIMVEPRRVAARAAARRIAEENGWRLGEEVGYQVRFERRAKASTQILVVTEGILVQRLQHDLFLDGVATLVFDEFHERNLSSDLALAMARKVQLEARDDLRLLVMSATLDPEPLLRFLGGPEECSSCESDGRLFPVEVAYRRHVDARSLPTQVKETVPEVLEKTPGDVLVFLPGVGEIRRSQDFLGPIADTWDNGRGFDLVPLYGDLPPEAQDRALRRGPRRKVVLATNVAETSVTIDGVTAVIDSGQVRRLRFAPGLGLDRLELGRISLASAEQRKGRAGRQQAGYCLRLWTEQDHRGLPTRETAEIARVDLASMALELLAWGESDLSHFGFFEAPDPAALDRSLQVLVDLGAAEIDGGQTRITPLGHQLSRLPVHPRLARLIVAGHDLGFGEDACTVAALLSERDIVFRPVTHRPVRAMGVADSDLMDRLEGLEELERSGYGDTALGPVDRGRSRTVRRVADQLRRLLKRLDAGAQSPKTSTPDAAPGRVHNPGRDEAMARAVLTAFPDRVAKRREAGSRRAVMVGGRGVRLAEMSAVVEPALFVAVELDAGRGAEGLVRQASAVDPAWLAQHTRDEAYFDPERRRVLGRRLRRYRDLTLDESDIDPGPDRAAAVLAEAAQTHLDEALGLDDVPVAAFLTRLRSLRRWMPELELPAFDDRELAELLPALCAGKRSFDDLRRAPVLDVLRGVLDYPQREALDQKAPERLQVPSGSQIRLQYRDGEAPILAARIQELFGATETPSVAGGRVPVLLHLLAPNGRPQQVTDDLASFWANTYPLVRKELAGRYPKHAWPDDPLSAAPMRGAKRRRK
ncbi:MAG: ATP-dependent helicase HrpB [Acidobacteriota bacterium]